MMLYNKIVVMNLVDLEKLFIQRKYLLKKFFWKKMKRGSTKWHIVQYNLTIHNWICNGSGIVFCIAVPIVHGFIFYIGM